MDAFQLVQQVLCRISRILPGRTWWQTSHVAGGCVPTGPDHPLCRYTVRRQLAAVQRNRWLAEVGWSVMVQALKWPGHLGGSASLWVLPGYAKQMTEFMTSQSPGTKHYVPTQCHPHRRPCTHQSINQSSKTNIYVTSESEASHCAQRPPTTNVSHAMTACCQFQHRLIICYGISKIAYEIIQVSHP